jgi:hypothetical protein
MRVGRLIGWLVWLTLFFSSSILLYVQQTLRVCVATETVLACSISSAHWLMCEYHNLIDCRILLFVGAVLAWLVGAYLWLCVCV